MPPPPRATPAATDALMTTARVLVGVTAASVAAVEDQVTLPQLRVLVMAGDDELLTLTRVASILGVHPSNATRTCDRLVTAGFLDRRDNPDDRRQLQLTLTAHGRALVAQIMNHRRAAIETVLRRMQPAAQQRLAEALAEFAAAAHDADVDESPALAWAT
ncbi:MAG: MarR family transcriptional regulator [Actinomycetota bacterium]